MRTHLAIGLALALLLLGNAMSHDGGDVTATSTGAALAPEKLADRYVASLPNTLTENQRNNARHRYLSHFFEGYVYPQMVSCSGCMDCKHGREAGKMYRAINPESVDSIMKSYGYAYVELEGQYRSSFEESRFVRNVSRDSQQPADPLANVRQSPWWLSAIGHIDPARSKVNTNGGECETLHVKGYLSPTGRHGHLGAYDRRLFAQEASCSSPAKPAPPRYPFLASLAKPVDRDEPVPVPSDYPTTLRLRLDGKTSLATAMLVPMAQAGYRPATMDLLHVFVNGENDVARDVGRALMYRDMAKAQPGAINIGDLSCPDFNDPSKPMRDASRD